MVRGNYRGRRGGRGRPGRIVHAAVKAVENRDLRWKLFRPPVRQPSVNRCFTFNFTTVNGHLFSGDGSTSVKVLFRVEDIIKAVAQTVGMSGDWYSNIKVRVQRFMAYGITSATTDLIPVFSMTAYDPLTNEIAKIDGVQGDIDDPARTGVDLPTAISEHFLSWDGVTATSASVCAIVSSGKFYAAVYWNIVVVISKDDPTAIEPLNNLTVHSRPVVEEVHQDLMDKVVKNGHAKHGQVVVVDEQGYVVT